MGLKTKLYFFAILLALGACTDGSQPHSSSANTQEKPQLSIGDEQHHESIPEFAEGYLTTSDGISIHYFDGGEGTAVLLIHGFYVDAKWNYVDNGIATALARNHRVVMIDIRGHGKSDQPLDKSKYGDRLWQDCIELLDYLNIDQVHVHGYSMGGGIVTKIMVNARDRILSAGYGGSGIPETDPVWQARLPVDTEGQDPNDEYVWPTISTDRPVSKIMMEDTTTRDIITESGGGLKDLDLGDWKVPVLAITGEYDRPKAKAARMARELSDFRQVILPGKSHVTAVAKAYMPSEYVNALSRFIAEVDAVRE